MLGAQHRIPDFVSALAVRPLLDDLDAVREQELECRGAVVGKGADDLAVVVAVRC